MKYNWFSPFWLCCITGFFSSFSLWPSPALLNLASTFFCLKKFTIPAMIGTWVLGLSSKTKLLLIRSRIYYSTYLGVASISKWVLWIMKARMKVKKGRPYHQQVKTRNVSIISKKRLVPNQCKNQKQLQSDLVKYWRTGKSNSGTAVCTVMPGLFIVCWVWKFYVELWVRHKHAQKLLYNIVKKIKECIVEVWCLLMAAGFYMHMALPLILFNPFVFSSQSHQCDLRFSIVLICCIGTEQIEKHNIFYFK